MLLLFQFNPEIPRFSRPEETLLLESIVKRRSKIILFVIGSETRSVTTVCRRLFLCGLLSVLFGSIV